MASRSLNDLDSRFRVLANQLIADCEKANIPVRIITTLRTYKEQEEAVRIGTSWTMKSMHLPHPPEGKSLAIDIVPTVLLTEKNWAPKHPLWWQIGAIGMKLGLRWGGAWDGKVSPVGSTKPRWDAGHFELSMLSSAHAPLSPKSPRKRSAVVTAAA